jgi:hypothetical protein
MVLSVNSSSKVVVYFGAVATLALAAVLFYRFRGNTSEQATAASLDKGRFSFLANFPLISSVMNYFCPMTTKLSIQSIGSSAYRILSVNGLTEKLEWEKQRYQAIDTLIICGKNLEITKDPGILALNPMKVILVDVQIIMSFDDDSLDQLMVKSGWHAHELEGLNIIEVASVEEAVQANLPINPETFKPYPTVYSVKK